MLRGPLRGPEHEAPLPGVSLPAAGRSTPGFYEDLLRVKCGGSKSHSSIRAWPCGLLKWVGFGSEVVAAAPSINGQGPSRGSSSPPWHLGITLRLLFTR